MAKVTATDGSTIKFPWNINAVDQNGDEKFSAVIEDGKEFDLSKLPANVQKMLRKNGPRQGFVLTEGKG